MIQMSELRKTLVTLLLLSVVLFTGVIGSVLVVNRVFFTDDKVVEISSRQVLEKISDRYFVVTKTVFLDQKTTITVDEGSAWSNFWWGQTIEAQALIRLDIGVDLSGLSEEDIFVNKKDGVITMQIPGPTVLDASLSGDIDVQNSQGVLKKLLDSDTNADYNTALDRLIEDATATVQQDTNLFEDSKADAVRILELVVDDLGYSIVVKER